MAAIVGQRGKNSHLSSPKPEERRSTGRICRRAEIARADLPNLNKRKGVFSLCDSPDGIARPFGVRREEENRRAVSSF